MNKELNKLERVLKRYNPFSLESLLPGLKKEVIPHLFGPDLQPLPSLVMNIYSWSAGMTPTLSASTKQTKYFFPRMRLNTVSETNIWLSGMQDLSIIPIFSSGEGAVLGPHKNINDGRIYDYSPYGFGEEQPTVIFDSLSTMIDTVEAAYKAKYIFEVNNGRCEITEEFFDEFYLLGAKMNPHSNYWIE